MKRIISVAIALIMVFALTATVAAKDSPSAKEYYSVKVITEPEAGSFGTASSDKNQVEKDAEGTDGEVTLTASDENGFFTLWVIDGDYDIVSGDLNSPVITIRPKSDINAKAYFTEDKDDYHITAEAVGGGTVTTDPSSIKKNSGDIVIFEANDKTDVFTHWEIKGVYDIVEGSLTDKKLVIKPHTDVHAVAYFAGKGSTPDTSSSKSSSSGGSNQSGTSPKTGDPLFIVIGLAVLALGAGALAVKKIKER